MGGGRGSGAGHVRGRDPSKRDKKGRRPISRIDPKHVRKVVPANKEVFEGFALRLAERGIFKGKSKKAFGRASQEIVTIGKALGNMFNFIDVKKFIETVKLEHFQKVSEMKKFIDTLWLEIEEEKGEIEDGEEMYKPSEIKTIVNNNLKEIKTMVLAAHKKK